MPDRRHSVVGDLINFRRLVCSPLNKNSIIFLLGKVIELELTRMAIDVEML